MEFKSSRYFTLFDFFISHSQLLIRASKNDTYENNIDIVFFDVKFIKITPYFNGISIEKKESEYNLNDFVARLIGKGESELFEITSNDEKFLIVASFVGIYENKLDFNETSLGVLESKGREKLILALD